MVLARFHIDLLIYIGMVGRRGRCTIESSSSSVTTAAAALCSTAAELLNSDCLGSSSSPEAARTKQEKWHLLSTMIMTPTAALRCLYSQAWLNFEIAPTLAFLSQNHISRFKFIFYLILYPVPDISSFKSLLINPIPTRLFLCSKNQGGGGTSTSPSVGRGSKKTFCYFADLDLLCSSPPLQRCGVRRQVGCRSKYAVPFHLAFSACSMTSPSGYVDG